MNNMNKVLSFGLSLSLSLMAAPSWAVEAAKPENTAAPATVVAPSAVPVASSGSVGGQLAQLMFGLLVVIALIFALAWVLRRVQQIRPRGNQVIQMLASQALSPRDRLVLVQVGSEQVLLGLTPGRITPLHVLQHPVETPNVTPGTTPVTPEFAQRLMEMLGKDRKEK